MGPVYLSLLGAFIGFISGLLGIGGGVLTVPALLTLPPLWGEAAYSIQMATGISMVQSFAGSFSGLWVHARKGMLRFSILLPLITGSLCGGFLGGVFSSVIPTLGLYLLFAGTLVLVLGISLFQQIVHLPTSEDFTTTSPLGFGRGFLIGGGISFLAANTGIGGAAILMPILIYLQKIPTRVAIATGAGFVVLTALSAILGKWLTHLLPLQDALWLSLGALVGGMLGGLCSHRFSPTLLQRLLIVFIVLALVRTLYAIPALL